MARATMYFPHDFLWGTATSSLQVEGNNTNSDWWSFEQQEGRILAGHRSGLACDWWRNAESDLDRAAEMGTNAHRLSLEWSRIEPEPSVFDEDALGRYREIIQGMRQRGIDPMVTLHHFSNPLWLVEKGDFSADIVTEYFRRYTAKVAASLGDVVGKWVTINEPMVYLFARYFDGTFPPARKMGWNAGMKALRHLFSCHAIAYRTLKEANPQAIVGVAKNMPVFASRTGSLPTRWWAGRLNWLFNELWMDGMVSGRLRWPAGRGSVPHLADSFDFVGINYYTRFYVRFPPTGGEFYYKDWGPDAQVGDGNYGEVYPAGLFQVIKAAMRYGKPIYITENGLPDADDDLRPAFLLTHLREIWRAVSFNFPVMGYYHWSLVDNFEWDRGWTQRFGLYEMDPDTQARRIRPGGRLYTEICHANGISSDMAAQYAPELLATMFPGGA